VLLTFTLIPFDQKKCSAGETSSFRTKSASGHNCVRPTCFLFSLKKQSIADRRWKAKFGDYIATGRSAYFKVSSRNIVQLRLRAYQIFGKPFNSVHIWTHLPSISSL